MSKQRTYKTFTREFKLEAVRMMDEEDDDGSVCGFMWVGYFIYDLTLARPKKIYYEGRS
jgi:hypothetical protein